MDSQTTHRTPTIRLYLLLIALAALLPVWGMAGHVAGRMAETERARLVKSASDTARDIAYGLELELAGLRGVMAALATSPALQSRDFKSFYDQARALPMARKARICLTDAAGEVLLDSTSPFTGSGGSGPMPTAFLDAPRRAGIARLRLPTRPGENPRLDITEEVTTTAGAQQFFLTAAFDPAMIWDGPLQRMDLPKDWLALVAEENTRVLVRMPPLEPLIGQTARPDSPIAAAFASNEVSGWTSGLS